ncbi:MAG: DNA polymerase III subunit delta [Prevotellaceae bacterium]|jgi:DNA polymerase-3 subunit delta|nr:DNA polymerase III subunit delta [Prevotellaceae bacterium]
MAKQETTYEEVMRELRAKRYRPVYYLMGEEAYYIDLISNFITEHVLTEEEKEFNQTVIYATPDTDIATVINAAKRYPMMAERQVIVLREAQNIKSMDALSFYLLKPMPTTILVICHKHGALDRRKKLASEIEKAGVLFESKKVKDGMLPSFIADYLKQKKVTADPKATAMLAEFIGTDLSRMVGELDKLIITLPADATVITADQVEKNIGISKEYNGFELRNALVVKDVQKANKIIKYFAENPKTNPIQMTLALLFNFYANLMLAYYAPTKSDQGVAAMLGLKSPWAAKDYMVAMSKYSGVKVMQIISDIRYADAQSKGVENSSVSNADIMRELLFKILH